MSTRTGRFARNNRLSQPADYTQAFKTRRRSSDGYFLVLANKNNNSVARLGLAISKKAIGPAVKRNLVKRLAREYFRQNMESFRGWDIVIVANKPIKNLDKQQLRNSLADHWQRLEQCV